MAGCDASGDFPMPVSGTVPAQVFVVDDGERIFPQGGDLPLAQGVGNPVWGPGQPVRLFALPGETVAIQVVVAAGDVPLSGVTVDLPGLHGARDLSDPDPPARARGAVTPPPPFRHIERFVVANLDLAQRSGGPDAGVSLGWAKGAMPDDSGNRGRLPEPLIPVEVAPSWADYPMTIPLGERRAIWIDITLPEQDFPAGTYTGSIWVQAVAQETQALTPVTQLPLEIAVGPVALPYAAVRTMVFYDVDEIHGRTGSSNAVRHYLQVMHRHHLTPVFQVNTPADVAAQHDELTGALFTADQGYDGPGMNRPIDVIPLGTYGSLKAPTAASIAQVEQTVTALLPIRAMPPERDVFLYAVDEDCSSTLGPDWRAALSKSKIPAVRQLLVGQTCSDDPRTQPVDLAMMFASAYNPDWAKTARQNGKKVWIYNGQLPQTGAFLSDGGALSLRANGWIQQRFGIDRWFYWE